VINDHFLSAVEKEASAVNEILGSMVLERDHIAISIWDLPRHPTPFTVVRYFTIGVYMSVSNCKIHNCHRCVYYCTATTIVIITSEAVDITGFDDLEFDQQRIKTHGRDAPIPVSTVGDNIEVLGDFSFLW